jgi:hypothetical protein
VGWLQLAQEAIYLPIIAFCWKKSRFEINTNLKQDFPEINTKTVGYIANVFLYANVLPLLLSFFLMYAGTVLLLRNYSKKLGKIKFWVIICIL